MSKTSKQAVVVVVHSTSGAISHREAAERIGQAASRVTTKQEAQKVLRAAGIFNRHNKLVKALA